MYDRSGNKNSNWRGGRIIDPRGYALIRVGEGHRLADVRGYAYEHRIVAEAMLGRPLRKGERVLHRTKDIGNNEPSNLRVPTKPNNVEIECACGCGARFMRFDRWGRERQFVSGHNRPSRNEHGQFEVTP